MNINVQHVQNGSRELMFKWITLSLAVALGHMMIYHVL